MTFNPIHNQNILILAVVRSSDKTVISQFIRNKDVTIEGVRECIASNPKLTAGKRYTTQGSDQSIHYTMDPQGRVFAMVTVSRYSPRVAFAALDEFQTMFNKELGMKASNATEGQLSKASKPIYKHIYEKFESPENVDRLAAVSQKVDVVKTVMKENIEEILKNNEKLEEIEEKAKNLDNQAIEFHKGTKDLAQKMWWKKWKMRLLLGFLISSVLVLIIVPTAVANSSSSKK